MDTSIIAALSALGGALVGSVSSFAGIWLAQRSESRRALRRDLFAAAAKLWETRLSYAAVESQPVLPLDDFIIDVLGMESILGKLDRITDAELIDLLEARDRRFKALAKYRFRDEKPGEDSAHDSRHL